jgi:acid stress-induced BolA-like protein IbaG/YrbA
MENTQIESLLNEQVGLAEVHVKSEGTHYNIIAVDDCFDGMSRVKKQQTIYGPLKALIEDGTIHAVSIKAYTVKEWTREKKFNLPS